MYNVAMQVELICCVPLAFVSLLKIMASGGGDVSCAALDGLKIDLEYFYETSKRHSPSTVSELRSHHTVSNRRAAFIDWMSISR